MAYTLFPASPRRPAALVRQLPQRQSCHAGAWMNEAWGLSAMPGCIKPIQH